MFILINVHGVFLFNGKTHLTYTLVKKEGMNDTLGWNGQVVSVMKVK